MTLTIRPRSLSSVPVEVEGITPDLMAGRGLDEIQSLPVYDGNRKRALGELFDVAGDASDGHTIWEGNLAGVHWIGAEMRSGRCEVLGDAGRHVGSDMLGGEIHVSGNAGDWVGGEMHGGLIHVRGNAGHLVGAAYRGSARGMTGGTILVEGNAGNEIGHTMRRGLIAVGGSIGDLAGFNMLAGSILIFGSSGIRHAAGMRRGTLCFFGDEMPPILPTFAPACRSTPLAITLVLRHLAELGFPVDADVLSAPLDQYHGDLVAGGRGEIFLRAHS